MSTPTRGDYVPRRFCLDCDEIGRWRHGRCPVHQEPFDERERARRAGRNRRGGRYGPEFVRERRRWARRIALDGGVPCARCSEMIDVGEDWHLDHQDDGVTLWPAHPGCNMSAQVHDRSRRGDA